MDQRPVPAGEKPRLEPEILPPGETDARWQGAAGRSFGAAHRVYVARIGPLGFLLVALAVAALAVLVMVVILGAFLLWLPIAGLLIAAAVISGMFGRRRWR